MTNVLIANIGNRDVWVAKDAPIPGDTHPVWNQEASLRDLGKKLQEKWSEVVSHVDLPILAKAIDYVREEAGTIDHVVLIASDQSAEADVSQRHLDQDTCEMVPIITRLLVDRHGLDAEGVEHYIVRTNPADYRGMQRFFQELFPGFHDTYPEAAFYLEVSGGTPAMTSMLLTEGAKAFGVQAYPLYVSPTYEEPFLLDLGRRTAAESLQRVVQQNVEIYAYHAAADTVRDHLALLRDFVPADTLLALLEYGRHCVNFNFADALAVLEQAPSDAVSEDMIWLQRGLRPDARWWLLHEIVHNAELRLRAGDYGDFLVRLFRFDEAAHRHAALDLGARFVDWEDRPDPDGEVVDEAWLESMPSLQAYFDEKNVRRTKDQRVRVTRYVLSLLVAHLAREQDKSEPQALLKRLGKINKLSDVRNSSFATHSFDGVTVRRIAEAFAGSSNTRNAQETVKAIMRTVKDACELVTGRAMDPVNPYNRLNRTINRLLAV